MNEQGLDLYQDHQTVAGKEKSLADIEELILNYQATGDQILSWYYSQDPLQETTLLHENNYLSTRNSSYAQRALELNTRKIFLFEKAGAQLLSETVFPEDFTGTPREGYEKMCTRYKDAFESGKSDGDPDIPIITASLVKGDIYSPSKISSHVLRALQSGEKPISDYEGLKRIFHAAEMIYLASLDQNWYVDQYGKQGKGPQKINMNIASKLFEYVGKTGIEQNDFRSKLMSLKATWTSNSYKLGMIKQFILSKSTSSNLGVPNEIKTMAKYQEALMLINMIDQLERVFLAKPSPDLKSGEIRGLLHEFIWQLDMDILTLIKDDTDTLYFPAVAYQDAPKIDHPENRRGFDFLLRNARTRAEIPIQLKSKPQHFQKTYHPSIRVLTEQNFQDVNPRILTLKLMAYKKYIEERTPESLRNAERFILPTAKEAWGLINSDGQKDLRGSLSQTYSEHQKVPKNKAARRRLRKEMLKKGVAPDF